MTDEELQAIRERAEKATPGPWHVFVKWRLEVHDADGNQIADIGYLSDATDEQRREMDADASFIAHSRDAIPALLAEVERLRALLVGEQ